MCDKTILENGGNLEPVAVCCKNQEMYNKAADNHPHALEFVSDCYMTRKMCDSQTVDTHSSTMKYVPDKFKTQEMCYKPVHKCFLFEMSFRA